MTRTVPAKAAFIFKMVGFEIANNRMLYLPNENPKEPPL